MDACNTNSPINGAHGSNTNSPNNGCKRVEDSIQIMAPNDGLGDYQNIGGK